jgi:hypothetical protein
MRPMAKLLTPTVGARSSKLRGLCLGSDEISEAGLRSLTRLGYLERIDLRYVDLGNVDLQMLALPSLFDR